MFVFVQQTECEIAGWLRIDSLDTWIRQKAKSVKPKFFFRKLTAHNTDILKCFLGNQTIGASFEDSEAGDTPQLGFINILPAKYAAQPTICFK